MRETRLRRILKRFRSLKILRRPIGWRRFKPRFLRWKKRRLVKSPIG